jgi:predicted nucleic acid-binding protein
VLAECVYVLESVYRVPPKRVAGLLVSLLAMPSVEFDQPLAAMRCLALHGSFGLSFPDAYLVAHAEADESPIASFDHDIDRIGTVKRVEP